MPVHDWTRADEFLVHGFQFAWRVHLAESLNQGLLPESHYAQTARVELLETPPRTYAKGRVLIYIYRVSDHHPVCEIEIVEPADKNHPLAVEAFVRNGVEKIKAGVHLLLMDHFPPGRHDPGGLHRLIWEHFGEEYAPPAGKPLTTASYQADLLPTAYVEPLAVGDPLPTMPLFLTPDRYVNVPLAPPYDAAWNGTPAFWRAVVEGREPAPK